ncbi:MAG: HlyD family type I secretion periplasmic adaptor subunit [Gallionellaceae bacterium]|nr:HlyD family type I secretion periplasmic adaptor subunit [Gallionellaceae bacterium]
MTEKWHDKLQADAYDFAPDILRLQHQPPSPLPRAILWSLLALLVCLLLWAIFGKLDIVAVAQGKLVPQSSLKIVQPAEAGIVKEILVGEGDEVHVGQVLARMDAAFSDADGRTLENELHLKSLQLRRIDAELAGGTLKRSKDDLPELFTQVNAQYHARRQAYTDELGTARAQHDKAEQDLQSALEIESKLKQTVPLYREQDEAFQKLVKGGFVSKLMANEKSRDHIEKEQELRAQNFAVQSLRSSVRQSEQQIAQITSTYRQELQNERVQAEGEHHKLQQESGKQTHRNELLELKATQDGYVKDISTHTPGTVVSPGTILMTVVPKNDPIEAEVWITHLDAGFVSPGQHARVKLAAYPFQKYGMVEGEVSQVSPDATEPDKAQNETPGYRATIRLPKPFLENAGKRYTLTPGMQVTAEIILGRRSVLEYLISPVQKTVFEAGQER